MALAKQMPSTLQKLSLDVAWMLIKRIQGLGFRVCLGYSSPYILGLLRGKTGIVEKKMETRKNYSIFGYIILYNPLW